MSDIQPASLWRHDTLRRDTPTGGYGVAVRPEVRDEIIAEVAPKYGVRSAEVLATGVRQRRVISHARHEVMWRLRAIKGPDGRPKHSLPLIARSLNLIDHTSVLFGIRAHAARLDAQ